MKAKVTNAWSAVTESPGDGWPALTRVVVESTVPPAGHKLRRLSSIRWALELAGLSLNMPAGNLAVWDGLVAEFGVGETISDRVQVDVVLEHPAEARVEIVEGLPARTVVSFDRSFISRVLAGRTVAIDPGHGGRDAGALGPINLVEKDVVLDVAHRLAVSLSAAGARPVLTRQGDDEVSTAERVRRAVGAGAECFISLHTGHTARTVVGMRTLFLRGIPGGRELAACLHRGILRKSGRPDRGMGEGGSRLAGPLNIPVAYVELVCIANPLEEAWLRNPVFKDRLAQGICNGLKDYFAERREARPHLPPDAAPRWAAKSR